jgi:hypothetical protein
VLDSQLAHREVQWTSAASLPLDERAVALKPVSDTGFCQGQLAPKV